VFSAPFEAVYAIELPTPMTPAIEETLTTAPFPWLFICAETARVIWYGPMTLTA
jgi:hypothetical protein